MRCNKCKDVPLTHGAERVKCEKCGQICVVNYSYLRICDGCSVENNVCQYCGKELFDND